MKITYKFIDGENDISFDLDKNCVFFGPNGSGKTRILKTLVEISDFNLRIDSLTEIFAKYNIERLKIDNYYLNSKSDGTVIDLKKSNEKLKNKFIAKNYFAFNDIQQVFNEIRILNRGIPFFPSSIFRKQEIRINSIINNTKEFESLDKNREIRLLIQTSKRLLVDVDRNIKLLNVNEDFTDLEQIIHEGLAIINFIERKYEDYKFADGAIKQKIIGLNDANEKLKDLGIKNNAKYISTDLNEIDGIIKETESIFDKIKLMIGNEYLAIIDKEDFEINSDEKFESKKLITLQKELIDNKRKIDYLNMELSQFGKLKLGIDSNHLTVKKNGNELSYEILSSGEKRLLTLLLNVLFSKENLLLIDEPEISLSLAVQSKIIFSLKTIASKLNKKLIIATHAPYVYEACKKSDFELGELL